MASSRLLTALVTAVPLILAPVAPALAAPPVATLDALSSVTASEELTDRLIVKYDRPRTDAQKEQLLEHAAEDAGVEAGEDITQLSTTGTGAVVVELADEVTVADAEELAERVSADPAVAWAEPDRLVSVAAAAPTDPAYRNQWSMSQLQIPTAWDAATGAGTVVGVIDTGSTSHPDLDSRTIGGYDFIGDAYVDADGQPGRDGVYADPGDRPNAVRCGEANEWEAQSSWHGTHVAGIVAAAANNGVQGAGIAPGAKLLVGRALGACGVGWVSDIDAAIQWMAGAPVYGVPAAPRRADVINLSLGFLGECPASMQETIDTAVSRGVTVVVAAGNEGRSDSMFAPANCRNVIAVGAASSFGSVPDWSNGGPTVDVWAPGEDIYSTLNDGQFTPGRAIGGYRSGTSMAAPYVAGLVALLKQQNPQLTPAQIEARLKETSVRLPKGTLVQRQVNPLAALGLKAAPEIKGAIRTRYYADAATRVALGKPVSAERSNGAGGVYQQFERGKIIWSSRTGARVLKGAIGSRFAAAGSELGTLGYPTSDERSNGIGGSYQSFQKGKIIWSAKTGSRVVKGSIGSRYAAMSSEKGVLGYPTADERSNGIGGSYQLFQKGKIFWSSRTGAHAVKGAIGTRYTTLGSERSRLGYPTSGEYSSGGKTVQSFQGGTISWTARTGVVVKFR